MDAVRGPDTLPGDRVGVVRGSDTHPGDSLGGALGLEIVEVSILKKEIFPRPASW